MGRFIAKYTLCISNKMQHARIHVSEGKVHSDLLYRRVALVLGCTELHSRSSVARRYCEYILYSNQHATHDLVSYLLFTVAFIDYYDFLILFGN